MRWGTSGGAGILVPQADISYLRSRQTSVLGVGKGAKLLVKMPERSRSDMIEDWARTRISVQVGGGGIQEDSLDMERKNGKSWVCLELSQLHKGEHCYPLALKRIGFLRGRLGNKLETLIRYTHGDVPKTIKFIIPGIRVEERLGVVGGGQGTRSLLWFLTALGISHCSCFL